jgi:hypothetical protein
MTTSAQIKALFESYIQHDDDRFITYGMQIVAHEAKLGHDKFAQELPQFLILHGKKRDNLLLY